MCPLSFKDRCTKFDQLQKSVHEVRDRKSLRSDFVPPHDERDLSTPRVDKGRPAGVHGDVLPAAGAHPQGRVVDRLPSKLKD